MTKAVSEATFGQEVLSSNEPVLVDFWAEWCGPCRAIAPVLDELSSELEGKVKMSQNRPAADREGVIAGLAADGMPELSAAVRAAAAE